MANRKKKWKQFFFWGGSKITADSDCSHEIRRWLLLGRKAMTNLDSVLKSRDILCRQSSIYWRLWSFSSHVWMGELGHKEGRALQNQCFPTEVPEKTLERSLDSKEIKPVNPRGNEPWIFIGRTGAKAETPIFWQPDMKNWLIGKDPDAGKDWRQEEKGTAEDEMVGWHHRLDGHEFEQALWVWWWIWKPGVLQFMESQRDGHEWATELNN